MLFRSHLPPPAARQGDFFAIDNTILLKQRFSCVTMLCKTVVTFVCMVSPSKEALEKRHQYYDGMWGLLWLTLFALQNLGFWEFLQRKTNADFVFLPGITVVVQMSVLFVA